jgi:hypothetical protein
MRVVEQVLAYHGRRNSYNKVSRDYGVTPNLEFIDRVVGIRFPKTTQGLDELEDGQNMLKHSDMPQHIRERYERLYDLVIQTVQPK